MRRQPRHRIDVCQYLGRADPHPTRRLLRVFGVKVTEYEERTAALLERAAALEGDRAPELLRISAEIADLTADLNARLRDISVHVLDAEARVLGELRSQLGVRS